MNLFSPPGYIHQKYKTVLWSKLTVWCGGFFPLPKILSDNKDNRKSPQKIHPFHNDAVSALQPHYNNTSHSTITQFCFLVEIKSKELFYGLFNFFDSQRKPQGESKVDVLLNVTHNLHSNKSMRWERTKVILYTYYLGMVCKGCIPFPSWLTLSARKAGTLNMLSAMKIFDI